MKTVTADGMRGLDRTTIENDGVEGMTLMERAGRGCFRELKRFAAQAGLWKPAVVCCAGKGNNGGDAFVLARCCAEAEWPVEVRLTGTTSDLIGDAKIAWTRARKAGVEVHECPDSASWNGDALNALIPEIIIDGLLGTGTEGDPRGTVRDAVEWIQSMRHGAWIVALDQPTGLNSDRGVQGAPCVQADLTLTIALPGPGLLQPEGLAACGLIESVSIGFRPERIAAAKAAGEEEWNGPEELRALWKSRAHDCHKGSLGRVLIVGGSTGFSGAPALAGLGALNAGAGLVTILVPEPIVETVGSHAPELMVQGGPVNEKGMFDTRLWQEWQDRFEDYDAVVVGPGMGQSDDLILLIRQLIRGFKKPLILDADALNALAGQAHWIERTHGPVALTPHPGEMSRLFQQSIEEIQSNRSGMAAAGAKYTEATVILKGAGTVIAAPGGTTYINTSGNPGMATGGTGDVLSGMLAAFSAAGYEMTEAARLAVYLHGKAGDVASWRHTQACVTAGRLLEHLPDAFRCLEIR